MICDVICFLDFDDWWFGLLDILLWLMIGGDEFLVIDIDCLYWLIVIDFDLLIALCFACDMIVIWWFDLIRWLMWLMLIDWYDFCDCLWFGLIWLIAEIDNDWLIALIWYDVDLMMLIDWLILLCVMIWFVLMAWLICDWWFDLIDDWLICCVAWWWLWLICLRAKWLLMWDDILACDSWLCDCDCLWYVLWLMIVLMNACLCVADSLIVCCEDSWFACAIDWWLWLWWLIEWFVGIDLMIVLDSIADSDWLMAMILLLWVWCVCLLPAVDVMCAAICLIACCGLWFVILIDWLIWLIFWWLIDWLEFDSWLMCGWLCVILIDSN